MSPASLLLAALALCGPTSAWAGSGCSGTTQGPTSLVLERLWPSPSMYYQGLLLNVHMCGRFKLIITANGSLAMSPALALPSPYSDGNISSKYGPTSHLGCDGLEWRGQLPSDGGGGTGQPYIPLQMYKHGVPQTQQRFELTRTPAGKLAIQCSDNDIAPWQDLVLRITTPGACLLGVAAEPCADAITCVPCAQGLGLVKAVNAPQQLCLPCLPGTSGSPKPGTCTLCNPGSSSDDISTSSPCLECPVGTYAPTPGAVACLQCSSNSASKPGQASCGTCPAGSWADAQPIPGSQCLTCNNGRKCLASGPAQTPTWGSSPLTPQTPEYVSPCKGNPVTPRSTAPLFVLAATAPATPTCRATLHASALARLQLYLNASCSAAARFTQLAFLPDTWGTWAPPVTAPLSDGTWAGPSAATVTPAAAAAAASKYGPTSAQLQGFGRGRREELEPPGSFALALNETASPAVLYHVFNTSLLHFIGSGAYGSGASGSSGSGGQMPVRASFREVVQQLGLWGQLQRRSLRIALPGASGSFAVTWFVTSGDTAERFLRNVWPSWHPFLPPMFEVNAYHPRFTPGINPDRTGITFKTAGEPTCTYHLRLVGKDPFFDLSPQPCPPGKPSCANAQRACPPGAYPVPSPGGTFTCALCAPGTASTGGTGACTPCKEGTYAQGVGNARCSPCAPGRWAPPGSPLCTLCNGGGAAPYVRPAADFTQVALNTRYRFDGGAKKCVPWPKGTQSPTHPLHPPHTRARARAPTQSAANTRYRFDGGAKKCVPCPEGTFAAGVLSPSGVGRCFAVVGGDVCTAGGSGTCTLGKGPGPRLAAATLSLAGHDATAFATPSCAPFVKLLNCYKALGAWFGYEQKPDNAQLALALEFARSGVDTRDRAAVELVTGCQRYLDEGRVPTKGMRLLDTTALWLDGCRGSGPCHRALVQPHHSKPGHLKLSFYDWSRHALDGRITTFDGLPAFMAAQLRATAGSPPPDPAQACTIELKLEAGRLFGMAGTAKTCPPGTEPKGSSSGSSRTTSTGTGSACQICWAGTSSPGGGAPCKRCNPYGAGIAGAPSCIVY